jgi:hypothetical protein
MLHELEQETKTTRRMPGRSSNRSPREFTFESADVVSTIALLPVSVDSEGPANRAMDVIRRELGLPATD